MHGIFKYVSVLLVLSSCATYQSLKPHDRVLFGIGVGSASAFALVGSGPLSLAYVVMGGTLTGSIIGVYELVEMNNQPRIPKNLFTQKKLIEQGTGRLKYLTDQDPNLLINWKLYQSGVWVKNSGDQFLFIDKVVEFEPVDKFESLQK
jgi:hypothetical protein